MNFFSKKLALHATTSVPPLIAFQMTSFVIPWLITIWYTSQSALTEAGQFSFALAVISPLCVLLAAPSRNFLLTHTNIVGEAYLSRLLLMVIGVILAAIIGGYFSALVLFSALFLFKSTELLFDLSISQAITSNNIRQLWRINLLKWLIIIVLSLFSVFSDNIEMILVLGTIGFFVTSSIGLTKLFCHRTLSNSLSLIWKSTPLGISTLIFAVHFNIPRYILAGYDQHKLLAIYSISSFLTMASVVLINIFIQTKLPILKTHYLNNDPCFKPFISRLSLLMLLIFCGLQLVHLPPLTTLFWQLHNNVQREHAEFFTAFQQTVLLAWGAMAFSVSNYFLMITGQLKTLLAITIVNSIVTFFICLLCFHYLSFFAMLLAYNFGCVMQCLMIYLLFKRNRAPHD